MQFFFLGDSVTLLYPSFAGPAEELRATRLPGNQSFYSLHLCQNWHNLNSNEPGTEAHSEAIGMDGRFSGDSRGLSASGEE